MEEFYAVIGIRWAERHGKWKRYKQIKCICEDSGIARDIASYLNNTQTRYEYVVTLIPNYTSLEEYIYFEE